VTDRHTVDLAAAITQLTAQVQRLADTQAIPVVEHVLADDDTKTARRAVALATPCRHCPHPYNWHATRGGCEFSTETEQCSCTAFAPGERPEPVAPRSILGTEPPADVDATCRHMETRTSPPYCNGPCGEQPCARFESDDPRPWLDPAEASAADEDQTLKWARRESLLVLLTRLQRGRMLTEEDAGTLRHHIETEMREADTARAVAAAGNKRHIQTMYAELAAAQAAAIKRVRALLDTHLDPLATAAVQRALDGTEQPTT
jgi:hypothetical protein